MTRQEIARGNGYSLVSIGNGWAYEFGYNGKTLFFQDDDATRFRESWDALEASNPHMHASALLRHMWSMWV